MIVNPVVYGGAAETCSGTIYHNGAVYLAKECGEQEGRDMFLSLAGQELGHYDTLCRSGEKILDRNHGTEEQRTVWGALMSTSGDWATELREKIDRVRHTN